jgi:hypothetical protein
MSINKLYYDVIYDAFSWKFLFARETQKELHTYFLYIHMFIFPTTLMFVGNEEEIPTKKIQQMPD